MAHPNPIQWFPPPYSRPGDDPFCMEYMDEGADDIENLTASKCIDQAESSSVSKRQTLPLVVIEKVPSHFEEKPSQSSNSTYWMGHSNPLYQLALSQSLQKRSNERSESSSSTLVNEWLTPDEIAARDSKYFRKRFARVPIGLADSTLPGLIPCLGSNDDDDSDMEWEAPNEMLSSDSTGTTYGPSCKIKEEADAWERTFPDIADGMDYKEEQAYFSSLEISNHPNLARLQFHARMGNLWESAWTILANCHVKPIDLTESEFVALVCSQGNDTTAWLCENIRPIAHRRINQRLATNVHLREKGISPRMLEEMFLDIYSPKDSSEKNYLDLDMIECLEFLNTYVREQGEATVEAKDSTRTVASNKAKEEGLSYDDWSIETKSRSDPQASHSKDFSFEDQGAKNVDVDRDAELVKSSIASKRLTNKHSCPTSITGTTVVIPEYDAGATITTDNPESSPDSQVETRECFVKISSGYIEYLESRCKYELEYDYVDKYTVDIATDELWMAEKYIREQPEVVQEVPQETWVDVLKPRSGKRISRRFSSGSTGSIGSTGARGSVREIAVSKFKGTIRKTWGRMRAKFSRRSFRAS